MIPGEYVLTTDPITCNADKKTRIINVVNRGDRPIQVGSHYHFAEANPALEFDRLAARGMRLDSPAGTAVRFEPGDARSVHLVEVGGTREIYGLRDDVNGPVGSTVSMFSTEAIGGSAGYDIARDPDLAERHAEQRTKRSDLPDTIAGDRTETASPVKNSSATDEEFLTDPTHTNSTTSGSHASGDRATGASRAEEKAAEQMAHDTEEDRS